VKFLDAEMVIWRAVPDEATGGLLHPRELQVEDGVVMMGLAFGALRLEEVEWKGRLLRGAELAEALGPYWQERFE
jgi:hypothetical protein